MNNIGRVLRVFKETICTLEDYLLDPDVYTNEISTLQEKLLILYNKLRRANVEIGDDWLERLRDVGVMTIYSRINVEE